MGLIWACISLRVLRFVFLECREAVEEGFERGVVFDGPLSMMILDWVGKAKLWRTNSWCAAAEVPILWEKRLVDRVQHRPPRHLGSLSTSYEASDWPKPLNFGLARISPAAGIRHS